MTEPRLFVAPDGENEPTIWRGTNEAASPVIRRCDLPAEHRDLWATIAGALTTD